MKKTFVTSFAAVAVVAAFAASAQADFVPWTYNWSRTPIAVPADVPGTGGLTLTDEPVNHAVGTSDIVATNIRSFSSAVRGTPDKFTNKPYTLTLFLQDDGSGQHTTLNFSGVFNGTLSANSANIATTFTGSVSQTVVLGGHHYTVSIGPYAPPGPPTASNAGSISAHVTVDEIASSGGGGTGTGGGGTSDAPEPSTLVLAASGLSFLGAAGWRKLRRRNVIRELAYA